MKTRISVLLAVLLALVPISVVAQSESPAPSAMPGVDQGLVAALCGSVTADDTELSACISDVETTLRGIEAEAVDGPTLQERAQALADDTGALVSDALEQVRETDLQAGIDNVLADIAEVELPTSVEDLIASVEDIEVDMDLDVRAAVDDAVADATAAADELDVQGSIEDALAAAGVAIEDAEVQARIDEVVAAIEERVEDTRVIVAEAQEFAEENPETVCLGSSLGLGAAVGLTVVAVTSIEPLGLQAFRTTERFSNDFCSDLFGLEEVGD